ncbi:uncharacterized protein LOC129760272 [Uranotaenia lowii]|uniref:uncharacterized protein LOC129760272 n=1 Tax=Uranotaenia lowii TaxID=190385 RepID=UPI0024785EBD|nr:uncharacterized protein LOC129760272 [Uranotaenia lowii]
MCSCFTRVFGGSRTGVDLRCPVSQSWLKNVASKAVLLKAPPRFFQRLRRTAKYENATEIRAQSTQKEKQTGCLSVESSSLKSTTSSSHQTPIGVFFPEPKVVPSGNWCRILLEAEAGCHVGCQWCSTGLVIG